MDLVTNTRLLAYVKMVESYEKSIDTLLKELSTLKSGYRASIRLLDAILKAEVRQSGRSEVVVVDLGQRKAVRLTIVNDHAVIRRMRVVSDPKKDLEDQLGMF